MASENGILNSYDNSILYTDYVLNELIETVARTNRVSSVVFFSDHGENLLDDNGSRFGHGGVIPTLYVTDVPMFIWTSKKFQQQYPVMVDNIRLNRTKSVSNLYLFDTLLEMGSIRIDGSRPCFQSGRLRFYRWRTLYSEYQLQTAKIQ